MLFRSDGSASTHEVTYLDNGVHTVAVKVTDTDGAFDTNSSTITVLNVSPAVASLPDASLIAGETYEASGSFSDPGTEDTWDGSVSYGESGPELLAVTGLGFNLSHQYVAEGSFTIEVVITDDDGGVGSASAAITVITPDQAADDIETNIDDLEEEEVLSHGNATDLRAHLQQAQKAIDKGDVEKAIARLEAFKQRVDQKLRRGRLSAESAAALTAEADRLIAALEAQG